MSRFSALLVCLASCAGSAPRAPLAQVPYEAPLVPRLAELDDTMLAGVRLQQSSCETLTAERSARADSDVAQMREMVTYARGVWRRSAGDACPKDHSLWPDTIGESFGRGGLGLTGTGGAEAVPPPSSSRTNVQVRGVDEADRVKHDGAYVYLLSGSALHILEAKGARRIARIALPGRGRQLFLEGDRLVVYASTGDRPIPPCPYAYDCEVVGDGTHTQLLVYRITDRGHPQLERTVKLSGSLLAARRIGSAVHTVVADQALPLSHRAAPDAMPQCGLNAAARARAEKRWSKLLADTEAEIRAYWSQLPTVSDGESTRTLCSAYSARVPGTALTSLVSIDLLEPNKAPVAHTVRSGGGIVYASAQHMILAVYQSVQTELHAFRIDGGMEGTRYLGSGIVPGHLINQFAMDEHEGVLRVASTRGRVPDPGVESMVSTLALSPRGNLVSVGVLEHLAPHEDIRAVRFDRDRGYLVTFKKTDPLFVLDLKDPSAPAVLGEFESPGFSTYLQRMDERHLLSIGYDADDRGGAALVGGLLLQLFDVSDPHTPKLVHRLQLGDRGSSSEAAGDHLAFTYVPERDLLAVPTTLCEGPSVGPLGGKLSFSGLMLFRASTVNGFTEIGRIDHGRSGASCQSWWSHPTSHVQRSLVVGDRVFSIAPDRVNVRSLTQLGVPLASIPL